MQPYLRSQSTSGSESTHFNTPCPLPHTSIEYSIPATKATSVSTPEPRQATPGPSAMETVVQQWSPINTPDTQANTTVFVPSMPELSYQARAGIKRLTGKELEHYGTTLSSIPQKQVAEAVDNLVSNVSSKPERAKIMTRVLGTLQLQQEMADSTIPVIWDTVRREQLWNSHGGEMAFKEMVSYEKDIKPVIAKVNLSEQRKLRYENLLNEHWGGDWKLALDPQGTLLPGQLSEHLLQKLTHIPKSWTADQVHQALRYQVKHRAKGGRRGVRTTLLLMPEDISQVIEKLSALAGGNNDEGVEITAEAFEATFPLKQRASTCFGKNDEGIEGVSRLNTSPQQVATAGRRGTSTNQVDKGKLVGVYLLSDEARHSEENNKEVHSESQEEDKVGSGSREPNLIPGQGSGVDSGDQDNGSQRNEISEDVTNEVREHRSRLQTPMSEPKAVKAEETDHRIMTRPDSLCHQSPSTSTQLDPDGDAPMLDASSIVSTSAPPQDKSQSTRCLSVSMEEQRLPLRIILPSTTQENRPLAIADEPSTPLAPEFRRKWWDHLRQLGISVRDGPLPHPIPGLPTHFRDMLVLEWKRELDMHQNYAPANPSDAFLTTCFHSIAQQCLLQDPRLYLQAVNSRPERSHKLVGYPCSALYVAAGSIPPPHFRDINLEWHMKDWEKHSQRSVIRVSLSESNHVYLEAIEGIAGQESPDQWQEQVLAALGGVSTGLATHQTGRELVSGGAAWKEVDTEPIMICPVRIPLRISQVVQPRTLRFIDLHYLTTEDNELELKWLGTPDSVSRLHRDQYIPPCLPSGDGIPGTQNSSQRIPFTVELRGVWAVGDAILGLRSWDSPVILEELRQLDDEGFVEDILNRIALRAMECYSKLDEWKRLQGKLQRL